MRDIAEWLGSIGLGEYAQRFAENAIDFSTLRDLTEQDLKDLGVLLGHRRKMLRAIAELDDAPAPAESATKPESPDEAERRHLTVMFCDLVGSTALAARLDPEDMRTLIGAYHRRITEVISRHQGIIGRYMGDGVLVYFGYPQAHEDDAEQAVRAGLALVDAVAKLPTDTDLALSARIGIATGVTVVGDLTGEGAAQEQVAIGETPNLAARLQTLADPGTVFICPTTRRLTGGHFDYRDLGPQALKGWAEPISVWRVLSASGVESRFAAMHKTKLPALFGREEEIELLLRRWRHATQEEGRVVMLTGEPGIGKSHIALALDGGSRVNHISRCAISALRTIPTVLCSHSSANSSVLPGSSTATRLRRSCPSSTLYWRNPHTIPNTWQFWPTCWRCRPMITTDCRIWLRKNAKRRP
jgi:class 3 adenylate cyclase